MGRVLKPWTGAWRTVDRPEISSSTSSHPLQLQWLGLALKRFFLLGTATILILLLSLLRIPTPAVAMSTSGFSNQTPMISEPIACAGPETTARDNGKVAMSLWFSGAVTCLALVASILFDMKAVPNFFIVLSKLLLSPPTEHLKVVERIIPVNCTCNGSSVPSHSARVIATIDPYERPQTPPKTVDECLEQFKAQRSQELSDAEIIELTLRGLIPCHSLEKTLGDYSRAVRIRRAVVSRTPGTIQSAAVEVSQLPFRDYDFSRVFGACAENVIGYMPIPTGVAGPIRVDGSLVFLPMATTEGALIASTSRGAKAINAGTGATTVLTNDGMTRAPVVRFQNIIRASAMKRFIESAEGLKTVVKAFDSTSRFVRLQRVNSTLAGSYVYLRFTATTGDAMGMNMISKAVQEALTTLRRDCGFEDMAIVSLSGNYCTDKKAAAINWVNGRGKSVVAETVIPAKVVEQILKCSVPSLVQLNISKNLVGSALAGSIGGFNAHAANIVTAMFLATGQDAAQNMGSSSCLTLMEETAEGDLQMSVSMPSIEVGTVGGGTVLEPQAAMLDLVGVRGGSTELGQQEVGGNAARLARIIASGVLAGELSLCSALVTGELVQSHMIHNRKS